MEKIILVLFGIFIGIAITSYFCLDKIRRKDRRILNQKAMIDNREKLINYQRTLLNLIKEALDNRYYTVEKLEDKIKTILNQNSH